MSVVSPVDVVHILRHLLAETDRLNVQISKALVLRVDDKILSLDSHEFGVEPCSEQLAVEALIPLIVVVFIGIFKLDNI